MKNSLVADMLLAPCAVVVELMDRAADIESVVLDAMDIGNLVLHKRGIVDFVLGQVLVGMQMQVVLFHSRSIMIDIPMYTESNITNMCTGCNQFTF